MSEQDQDTSYGARADGFTPVFDVVVNDCESTTAGVVFGVVYRHTRMRLRVCKASLSTMARLTGLNEKTIRNWLVVLCERGWLVNTNPDAVGVPHVYRDTGKVELLLTAVTPELGSEVPPPPEDNPGTRFQGTPELGSEVPRNLIPDTPELDSDKDTIRRLSEETREGYNSSSSSVGTPETASEPPPEEEEEDAIPFLEELVSLGMRRKDAQHWLPIVGGENVRGWVDAVRGKDSPAGYLLTCWRNGDHEPPNTPHYTVISGRRRKVNPPAVVIDWDAKSEPDWGICSEPDCNAQRVICQHCGRCFVDHCTCEVDE